MEGCYRHTDYGEPIVALKSWIISPFVDEENVQILVRMILEARDHVERNTQDPSPSDS